MSKDAAELDWHIRPFRQEDIPAVAVLFDAADRADHLYKLSSEDDILETFGQPDASTQSQAIVAERPGDADGTLLGVGRVLPTFRRSAGERIYNILLRVHPSARQQGLQHTIARHLIEMALRTESAPTTERADKVRVRTYIFDKQVSSIEAWERVGLRKVRTGWTMERPLGEAIAVGQPPDGVVLRTYRRPDDNAQAVEAFNSAFYDYFDSSPISEDTWEHQMGASYSRPDLSWLAFSEGDPDKAVGVAICWVNESENRQTGRLEGWIEGIGVVPAFQQKGIGKTLLSRCLQSLHHAGMTTALADVDSESSRAVALFKSAGFSVRNALLQYECLLRDTKL